MSTPTVHRAGEATASVARRLPAAILVGYPLAYLLLDWLSFVHPMRGLNITPWNPQAALAVALLLWRPGHWWLVLAALVGAQTFVRGSLTAWHAELLSAIALTIGYTLTAAAIRRWLRDSMRVATRRDFLVFAAIVSGCALLNAILFVGALAVFGTPPLERVMTAVLRGWVGEAVSLAVTLPVLLVLMSRERRAQTLAMARTTECWLVVLVGIATAFLVFGQPAEDQFKFFYLLFLPVVWGAARFGVTGAVWSAALVQALLIVAVQAAPYRPLTVFEFHTLLTALAATGLLLGTTVDEREEADKALRASLHLAAAGDMAAALAHELNQPLMALSAYAQASRLLVERLPHEPDDGVRPLMDVTAKLVQEASRASNVVKRLRDFFRDRRADLQHTDIAALVGDVVESQAARAEALNVRIEWTCDDAIPEVWLDRVQIDVVLRNLLSNALDAAAASGDSQAWVRVRAVREGNDVRISVHDSGPGIPSSALNDVFEARQSSKPGGMGIGLGISRAIVLAHGGRLWAEPGPGGRFAFTLPLARA